MDAYLDIETSYDMEIVVLGIYTSRRKFLQLVGDEIKRTSVLKSLRGIKRIFTYNGNRFDIPMIRKRLDIDLFRKFHCHDLMKDCHRKNLYGGLKGAESKLGIRRKTEGVDGYMAMKLWTRYSDFQDKRALKTLLAYNKEDVVNLHKIRKLISRKSYGKENIKS